jgi:hypothetical protein
MKDSGQSILPLTGSTLTEIDFLNPNTLKISYLINSSKIVNRLNYDVPEFAQSDYNDIIEMLGNNKSYLTE